jgi:hypothetical protein
VTPSLPRQAQRSRATCCTSLVALRGASGRTRHWLNVDDRAVPSRCRHSKLDLPSGRSEAARMLDPRSSSRTPARSATQISLCAVHPHVSCGGHEYVELQASAACGPSIHRLNPPSNAGSSSSTGETVRIRAPKPRRSRTTSVSRSGPVSRCCVKRKTTYGPLNAKPSICSVPTSGSKRRPSAIGRPRARQA